MADVRTDDILSGCVLSTFSHVNPSLSGRFPHNHDLHIVERSYILFIWAPVASSIFVFQGSSFISALKAPCNIVITKSKSRETQTSRRLQIYIGHEFSMSWTYYCVLLDTVFIVSGKKTKSNFTLKKS